MSNMKHDFDPENREVANATSLDPAILGKPVAKAKATHLASSTAVRELQLISNQLFRAASELKRTNHFQSMILDNINQGVVVVDEYSQLVAWNEVFLRLYGIEKKALHKGMHIQDFAALFASDAGKGRSAEQISYNSFLGSLEPGDYFDRLANQTSVEIRVAKRDTGGLIATYTDVTTHIDTQSRLKAQGEKLGLQVNELKTLGESLKEARNQAILADQQKSRFLAMISHDIRTPIGAVISTLELLSDPSMQGDRDRLHQVALTSGKQLLFLLADIIEVSRSDGWNFAIQNEPVVIRELLHSIADAWRPLAAKKQLQLDLHHTDLLPCTLQTDPKRLRQVIDNLLSNAIKFTETGAISLFAQITDNTIRFEVRDTGRGIQRDKQDNLFQEFGRVISANAPEVEGTGLGLSICKRIIESMAGSMGVQSESDVGSSFWFEIPYIQAEGVERLVGASQLAENLVTPAGNIPRILVADDVESIRMIVGMMVEQIGCTTAFASDGEQVLKLVESETFDAILIDSQMPTINGAEATRQIRALETHQKEIPIIGVTASAIGREHQDMLEAGMNAVLTKPLDGMHLRRILAELIG